MTMRFRSLTLAMSFAVLTVVSAQPRLRSFCSRLVASIG
jgi:hypothetical protein